jgi:hypothetical protein
MGVRVISHGAGKNYGKYRRGSWKEKLENSKDLPRIEKITEK